VSTMGRHSGLADRLIDQLRASGVLHSAPVEAALRSVPRAAFLSGANAGHASDDEALSLKVDLTGRPISTASQPSMVVLMLEQLDVRPGDRVLEVGTASGWDAALLDELAGPAGSVVTVELEPDLAAGARRALDASGHGRVTVLAGDGSLGHPPGAPYDRIIVTAGAPGVAPAWVQQLGDGGRLVVPVVDGTGAGRSLAYVKQEGRLVEEGGTPCRFVPLRHA
jgi:protein-L-isoaspartate(D-aspartate) O-methyltransferase